MEGIHILRSRLHGRIEWAAFRPTPYKLTRWLIRISVSLALGRQLSGSGGDDRVVPDL